MTLIDFLKTGTYLNLSVGMKETEIFSVFSKKQLGKKEYFNSIDENEGYSYFYDALEIMIIDSKIYSLGIDLSRDQVFFINDIILNNDISFELLLRYLDLMDIEWEFENKYCYDRELTIKTGGGVLIGCSYTKGNYLLSKFKVF